MEAQAAEREVDAAIGAGQISRKIPFDLRRERVPSMKSDGVRIQISWDTRYRQVVSGAMREPQAKDGVAIRQECELRHAIE
jgi:hypothetical protein